MHSTLWEGGRGATKHWPSCKLSPQLAWRGRHIKRHGPTKTVDNTQHRAEPCQGHTTNSEETLRYTLAPYWMTPEFWKYMVASFMIKVTAEVAVDRG